MSGIFNASIFNNTIFNTGASLDVVRTGTGGIDPKRRTIFKPTGLIDRKKIIPVAEPVEIEQIEEISDEVAAEFFADKRPTVTMSMAEIDFEIAYLMRKLYRTQEDELMLLILMAASE